jgi:hypothetical protein
MTKHVLDAVIRERREIKKLLKEFSSQIASMQEGIDQDRGIIRILNLNENDAPTKAKYERSMEALERIIFAIEKQVNVISLEAVSLTSRYTYWTTFDEDGEALFLLSRTH